MRATLMTLGGVAVLLAACGEPTAPLPPDAAKAAPAATAPSAPAVPAFDAWLGRWNGPEGTFVDVQRAGADFTLTIQTLDGPTRYPAQAAGDHLQFERDGQRESLRASDGQATGMKWLLDKHDCLTVKRGEGYCRD